MGWTATGDATVFLAFGGEFVFTRALTSVLLPQGILHWLVWLSRIQLLEWVMMRRAVAMALGAECLNGMAVRPRGGNSREKSRGGLARSTLVEPPSSIWLQGSCLGRKVSLVNVEKSSILQTCNTNLRKWGWTQILASRFNLQNRIILAGLNKLMAAWETMNGRTALDKRGELRQTFYMDLQRRPGERVTELATRFRSLVADLRAEGVNLHDNELGWWLKQKLGLDALRKQLLDTALQGSEDYNVIETEVLRLFRDLHDNDPLRRRFEPSQKLTVRRMFGGRPGSSAASSVGPSSSYRSSLPSISSNRSKSIWFSTI